MSSFASPPRRSSNAPVIIIVVVLFLVAFLAVPLLACLGAATWFFTRSVPAVPAGPVAAADRMTVASEPAYPTDYPHFDGKLDSLIPERVGRFRRTESVRALDLHDALQSWSAFFKDENGAEIHVRLQQHATPASAYDAISFDLTASVAIGTADRTAYDRKGRHAGTRVYGRYRNQVKNVDGDALWITIGNLAVIIGSKDGRFAEEFFDDYQKLLDY